MMDTHVARHDAGFTLIELLIVIGVIGIVCAITIPALLRAKITGNETAVLGSMRAVNSAQAAYAGAAANGNYANSFTVLVRACPGSSHGFTSRTSPAIPRSRPATAFSSAQAASGRARPTATVRQPAGVTTSRRFR
jgi:prepilin-type N-terminal cleavage/methylation domain-containing protein